MRIRKFGAFCGVVVGIAMSSSAALALGPVQSGGSTVAVQQDLVDVSFFGRPYPYGYTGWGSCVRYEEVETRRGPRLRRVRVCR
jgi:hypothetical protein